MQCRWSPEQIARKCLTNKAVMLVNPVLPDKALSVSHETIYRERVSQSLNKRAHTLGCQLVPTSAAVVAA